MSTQQDIYVASSESRPPMLNKENYVPWSSRLLRYAKSRPNGKLIHNSIINGPYVRRMIPEPAVDSCEIAQEIWLRVQQMMKGSDIGIQQKNANRPPMLNKENYVPWSSRLLRYAKSRPNGKLIHNSILNGPYVRRMISEPGDANRKVNVTETFHMQTDDELSEKELKQIEDDDQAIQTILLGLPEDIYAAVDSCETTQEIWLRVQQMMKGSDIGIQEKKAKLFNEWEREDCQQSQVLEQFATRIESTCFIVHQTKDLHTVDYNQLYDFLKYNQKENGLIGIQGNGNQNQIGNDNLVAARAEGNAAGQNGNQIRNKHFPKKIASNLKFLKNLQPEWSRYVTIVHQTKDLHTADYTQLYDFLKYNQKEVDELKAERLTKIQDPLALMANSNNLYAFPAPHQDLSPFNQNYMQQPIPNPKDITDPTTAMNMALVLMAKAFKLNYSIPTNNNQRISSNPKNRQIAQPGNLNGYNAIQNVGNQVAQNPRVQNDGIQNQIGNGNLVAVRAEGNTAGNNENQIRCYNCRGKEEAGIQLQAEEYDLMAAATDLDEIEEVNANCILMANLQQASSSGTQTDSTPVYDSDGSAEVHEYENCYNDEIFNMFTQEEQYTKLLEPIPESHQVPQNDNEEAAKFVGDFKSLANEVDASLAKHKALELEIERLLKVVVSQDIMNIMQKESVVDTSDLQTELERMKERFENCIIKKENEYAKLWILAQLRDLKGKSKDTSCVSDTRNPLSQKLENKNVELEFQVSDQKDNTHDTSANTKFAKQPIVENLPKVGETNALSKPVTSNSISTSQKSKGVNNDKVIAPGMFRINHFKTSREE
nr:hypothetical protein [Tanacetum cinerariifolium]